MDQPVKNVMSIDLEDWFCVYNLSHLLPIERWEQCESRVENSTLALLDLFDRHRIQATFFVLGWIAERYPALIAEVERRGHEIASHGYSHRLVTHLSPDQFSADLDRSLDVLSRCVSQPIRGFRAPSFSITERTLWALDAMQRVGLHYDSSVYPMSYHPDYGIGNAPLDRYRLPNGLWEIPMSCAVVGGRRIPCSGGGYFRLAPYTVSRWLLRRCNRQGRPVVFYLHPWEVDPGQPKMSLPWQKSLRHYTNLDRTMDRLEHLLADFRFTSIREAFQL